MNQDEVKHLLLAIDRVEADLRRNEHALYRVREQLARKFRIKKGEYGFVEPEVPNPGDEGA